MDNRDLQRIQHIKHYCEDIAETINRFGAEYNVFSTDKDYLYSVSLCLLQICEHSRVLSDEFKDATKEQIPWKSIQGMRTIFAHTYTKVSKEQVWATATKDVPTLLQFCENVLVQNHDRATPKITENKLSILGRLQEIQSSMEKGSNAKVPEVTKRNDDPIR